MTCEWIKANAAFYLYDELPDDARHELEQHLRRCPACEKAMAEERALHTLMSAVPVEEPTANLLAASRMKLQETLETAEQNKSWGFTLDIAQWMRELRFAPALAGALLMVGFAGGAVTTYMSRPAGNTVADSGSPAATPQIASITGITQEPGGQNVNIQYQRLVPTQASGSLSDPQIQQLLLFAARSNYNSGVRLDSIDVLTKNPQDERIREALIFSLRYDKNPGVRLKALEGLRPYVKSDLRVRDVMLEALLRDSNSGVRTEAIRALRPVTADSSVRQTLETLAAKDPNKFIQNESRRVLAQLPEIE